MARVDWKIGKPTEDGIYLTTLKISEDEQWVVLTRLEDGAWLTSGDITAWDYRPEPYDPYVVNVELDREDLEWQIKDLEAAWSEIHGEMKYHEGASEALLNVIKLMF